MAAHYVVFEIHENVSNQTVIALAAFDTKMKGMFCDTYHIPVDDASKIYIVPTIRFTYAFWGNKLMIADVFVDCPLYVTQFNYSDNRIVAIIPLGNEFAVVLSNNQNRIVEFCSRENTIVKISFNIRLNEFIAPWASKFFAYVVISEEFDDADIFVCSTTTAKLEFRAPKAEVYSAQGFYDFGSIRRIGNILYNEDTKEMGIFPFIDDKGKDRILVYGGFIVAPQEIDLSRFLVRIEPPKSCIVLLENETAWAAPMATIAEMQFIDVPFETV